MASQLTLSEVIKEAIQKEVLSRFMYIGLRQRVKSQESKDAFKLLAEQEEYHQHVLEDYLSGKLKEGTLSNNMVVDHSVTDHLGQPDVTPNMDIKDVYVLAVKKEQTANNFYSNLAAIHPEGKAKNLLEFLAAQELEHKAIVEKLSEDFNNPKTE